MKRLFLAFLAVAAFAQFAGCREKPKVTETRTVQIEEQQVKVMTNPDEVKQEVESTIESGMKAREQRMGE
jgi:hypothetical protein